MAAYEKYFEVTEYILTMLLDKYEQDKALEDRRLTISFLEPLDRVFKGICNGKAQLVKQEKFRRWVNYRLYCDKNHREQEITFRVLPYTKDINWKEF
jgi:hypothetical protein